MVRSKRMPQMVRELPPERATVAIAWVGATVLLAFVALVPQAAFAGESPELVARAKTHFRAGKTFYDLGQYDEAIREFAAGYAMVPKPEFLLNLGQAYRRNRESAKATEMFERYLEQTPPNAPERAQVKDMLAELRAERAATPKPAPPRDAPLVTAPSMVPNTLQTPEAPTEAVAAPPSATRHLAWALPVAAVVIAGAVVGVWAATRPAPDPCAGAAGLGCLDLRPK